MRAFVVGFVIAFLIGSAGVVLAAGFTNPRGLGSISLAASGTLKWLTRAILSSPADSKLKLTGSTAANGSYTIDISGFTKGETATLGTTTKTLTFAANPGDASKTTSGLIPDGAYLLGIVTRVVTAATNCTTCTYGDGTDVDLYGAAVECDVDTTTTTNADFTANIANPQLAAGEFTATAVGGNCFGLVLRVTSIYQTFTAPTAD